ncbi:hypothetical protein E4P39_19320 [Blastococcus sp. CT_GayMR19]|uniref:hypothetical protein n=1 Tax=Blastococcus sp. CT_GayMR19 TaxID=2559608 RepID=UPI0010742EEF|nr:hypothetical protein [Blastococcus sp. CT_GayMR19]TFV70753.1 hypothetical protein E4P39_19320 [Blastococcus sp. CT_GayMR19]
MDESLRAFLAIAMMTSGLALVAYAGYLHYVALPAEHAPRHVIIRTTLFVAGLVLALLGAGILR